MLQKIILLLVFLLTLLASCTSSIQLNERCTHSPRHVDYFDLPEGIVGYNNYEAALDCALKMDKPLAIYFTAFDCEECRIFEERFFLSEEVNELINTNLIFAALYTDDKREILEKDQFDADQEQSIQTYTIRTIGHLNTSLHNKFKFNIDQPALIIINNKEEIIAVIPTHDEHLLQINTLKTAIEKKS